jgi:hypothetical protein
MAVRRFPGRPTAGQSRALSVRCGRCALRSWESTLSRLFIRSARRPGLMRCALIGAIAGSGVSCAAASPGLTQGHRGRALHRRPRRRGRLQARHMYRRQVTRIRYTPPETTASPSCRPVRRLHPTGRHTVDQRREHRLAHPAQPATRRPAPRRRRSPLPHLATRRRHQDRLLPDPDARGQPRSAPHPRPRSRLSPSPPRQARSSCSDAEPTLTGHEAGAARFCLQAARWYASEAGDLTDRARQCPVVRDQGP